MNASDIDFINDPSAVTVVRITDDIFLRDTLENRCRHAAECQASRLEILPVGVSPRVCTCIVHQSAREYS